MKTTPMVLTLSAALTLSPAAFAGEAECLEEVARIHHSERMACYLAHGPKSGEFSVRNQEPLRSCLRRAKQQYADSVYGKCHYGQSRELKLDLGSFSY